MRNYVMGLLAALFVIVSAPAFAETTRAQAEAEISRFYSLPHIIGTAPTSPSWRADGRAVAYLWNDEGYDFRDLWLYDLDGNSVTRLTNLSGDARYVENAKGITEFVWLADGAVAYALRGDLYIRAGDGTTTRLTETPSAERQLVASPDGRAFSFVRDGDLWAYSLASKSSTRLVSLPFERQYIARHVWSPDGARIAFIQADMTSVPFREVPYYSGGKDRSIKLSRAFPGDHTGRYRVGFVDAAGGDALWVEHPAENPIRSFEWSANSKSLMVDSSTFLLEVRTIRTYDAKTGTATVFYEEKEPRQLDPAWSSAWAPDDNGLIIVSDHEGWYHLYHKARPNAALKAITKGSWEVANFNVDAKNKQIYFTANRDHPGERQLYKVSVKGGAITTVGQMPGTHTPYFAPDFAHAVDIASNDVTPPDLYLLQLQGSITARQVTKSPLAEFNDYTWSDVRYVNFKSHVDGADVVARMILPPDYDSSKKYPLIVGSVYSNAVRAQWGGRTSHPTWGLDQVLASHGYIILSPNMAGSWGQGKAFRQRLLSGYGGIDTDDLESGVRYLVSQGIVDPERVGIWGSSYGGLMTLMSLFNKPGLYAAGVAGAPASNVWHAYPGQMWTLGHTVHDNYERYKMQAAQHHAAGLEDNLMIIHGNADVVVLYGDTLDLVDRLMENEKTFELVTIPGSSHAWDVDNLTQTRFAFRKMLDFFDRYLKPDAK